MAGKKEKNESIKEEQKNKSIADKSRVPDQQNHMKDQENLRR